MLEICVYVIQFAGMDLNHQNYLKTTKAYQVEKCSKFHKKKARATKITVQV